MALLLLFRMFCRFPVDQGLKKNGERKIRAVDHFSYSSVKASSRKRKLESVKGHCVATEKLSHDHLDSLFDVTRLFLQYVVFRSCLFETQGYNATYLLSGRQEKFRVYGRPT